MSDKIKFKNEFGTEKNDNGFIEQEYDLETGEITFSGKVKINRNTKDGKRIFYYSYIDRTPITSYFVDKTPYRKIGGEKEKADELVKLKFGIDMDD